jgi:hypothetical protein
LKEHEQGLDTQDSSSGMEFLKIMKKIGIEIR